jgi:sec-independent protein translocase protein TatA
MLAAGPFGLGFPELLIILVVVILIFGASRLADVGGALGKSISEFRKAAREPDQPATSKTPSIATSPSAPMETAEHSATNSASEAKQHCTNCGAEVHGQGKFCASCGASLQAGVN